MKYKPNMLLVFVTILVIIFVIWLRAFRQRAPYDLIVGVTSIVWKIIFLMFIFMLLSIIINIMVILKESKQKETKQKQTLYAKIYHFITKFRIFNKLFESGKFRNFLWIFLHKGIYNYLIGEFAFFIKDTRFHIVFDVAWDILFLGKLNLYRALEAKIQNWDLTSILGTNYSKFMCYYAYYVFKFIPMLILNLIGLYEIFINYRLDMFYKSMWLLLIPFFFYILIRVQGVVYSHLQKEVETLYDFAYIFVFKKEIQVGANRLYCDISSIKFFMPRSTEELLAKNLPISLCKYVHYIVKTTISYHLYISSSENNKSNLLLSILTAVYLGCLIFY